MTNKTNVSKATVLPGLLLLSACGGKEHGKSAGQVIAKVNDEEISMHQVNFVLSRANSIDQDNVEIAKKQATNALVDQSLLIQQAMAVKLDRDPEIMMAIEHAKRLVLAQAWLKKATHDVKMHAAKAIEQYYQTHPELFGKHKIYKLKEVLIGKVDDKGKDEANNKGVQGLLPGAV